MISAFVIGLFGSVHCVVMCGPLMLTFTRTNGKSAFTSFGLYHLGRLLFYGFIGAIFGLLSFSVRFFEVQQYLSILLGAGILVVYLFPKVRSRIEGWYYHSWFYQFLKSRLTSYFSTRVRWFAAGILNGALPCGLVYLAAAGALLSGGMSNSFFYMILFGLGTLPMLSTFRYISHYVPRLPSRLSNLATPVGLLAGILLISRGWLSVAPDVNQLIKAQIMQVMTACGI
ncbi:sulfite exporter TauE/SafE family protein [Marinoscillum sp.]|uniref:sulfite exporter TauE/SafE family protein n=1 Tax=Marinoscillum sp. TaxID=2024838 RepID=UPI003BAD19B0